MSVTSIRSAWNKNTNGDLTFYPATSGTGTLNFGEDDTGLDVKFFGATASSFMLWDESADQLVFDAADLQLGDNDELRLGDAAGGDIKMFWNASNLVVQGTGAYTANGTSTVTISALAPAGVTTDTITKWLTLSDGTAVYYIPMWT